MDGRKNAMQKFIHNILSKTEAKIPNNISTKKEGNRSIVSDFEWIVVIN